MVKNFLKLNQTRYRVSPLYLESETKGIFAIACLGKTFAFHSESLTFSRIIRLFYFQKYKNLIGSRSCPNQTILGM